MGLKGNFNQRSGTKGQEATGSEPLQLNVNFGQSMGLMKTITCNLGDTLGVDGECGRDFGGGENSSGGGGGSSSGGSQSGKGCSTIAKYDIQSPSVAPKGLDHVLGFSCNSEGKDCATPQTIDMRPMLRDINSISDTLEALINCVNEDSSSESIRDLSITINNINSMISEFQQTINLIKNDTKAQSQWQKDFANKFNQLSDSVGNIDIKSVKGDITSIKVQLGDFKNSDYENSIQDISNVFKNVSHRIGKLENECCTDKTSHLWKEVAEMKTEFNKVQDVIINLYTMTHKNAKMGDCLSACATGQAPGMLRGGGAPEFTAEDLGLSRLEINTPASYDGGFSI